MNLAGLVHKGKILDVISTVLAKDLIPSGTFYTPVKDLYTSKSNVSPPVKDFREAPDFNPEAFPPGSLFGWQWAWIQETLAVESVVFSVVTSNTEVVVAPDGTLTANVCHRRAQIAVTPLVAGMLTVEVGRGKTRAYLGWVRQVLNLPEGQGKKALCVIPLGLGTLLVETWVALGGLASEVFVGNNSAHNRHQWKENTKLKLLVLSPTTYRSLLTQWSKWGANVFAACVFDEAHREPKLPFLAVELEVAPKLLLVTASGQDLQAALKVEAKKQPIRALRLFGTCEPKVPRQLTLPPGLLPRAVFRKVDVELSDADRELLRWLPSGQHALFLEGTLGDGLNHTVAGAHEALKRLDQQYQAGLKDFRYIDYLSARADDMAANFMASLSQRLNLEQLATLRTEALAVELSKQPARGIWQRSGRLLEVLSPHARAGLRMVTDYQTLAEDARPKLECPVCLDTPDIATSTLPCFHVFCRSCLSSALATGQGRCPSCRAQVAAQLPLLHEELEVSGKLGKMALDLRSWAASKQKGGRVIVLAHGYRGTRRMALALQQPGLAVWSLDGTNSAWTQALAGWSKEPPELTTHVLLVPLGSGAQITGLNLQLAEKVILLTWHAARDLRQSAARVLRRGGQEEVEFVLYAYAGHGEGTLEPLKTAVAVILGQAQPETLLRHNLQPF